MNAKKYIFILIFWFAIGGLTFTSCCIFNLSTKITFVEIQEEEGGCEDGFEEDGDESLKNEKYFFPLLFNVSIGTADFNQFSDLNKYDILNGFYLKLIKPPLI